MIDIDPLLYDPEIISNLVNNIISIDAEESTPLSLRQA
jgi:hypothetical protein